MYDWTVDIIFNFMPTRHSLQMWTEPTKKAEKTGGFLFYFVAKQFYLCEESAPLLFLAGKTAMNGIVGAFFCHYASQQIPFNDTKVWKIV